MKKEPAVESDTFSSIAGRYDLINRLLSLGLDMGWRRLLVNSLDLPEGGHILDGCTGTGDQALLLAAGFPSARVTGIDTSLEMLNAGTIKAERKKLEKRITLMQGNMHRLPFPDKTFDAVTVSFGIRNLKKLDTALQEMYRTMKPGGNLRILEFAPDPSGWGGAFKKAYIHRIVPFIGRLMSGSDRAYSYLSSSIASFLTPPEVSNRLKQTGWQGILSRSLFPGTTVLYSAVKPGENRS